mmetsp:Transcript_12357/g.14901  ORF Transcript_12357/g.14901 Transcript_12357/m.14901 type:complete len:113 (+) Transcript_12357:461-799(+)
MMLAVIIDPVAHIALHGDHQIEHRQDLARGLQLARFVLHDPVQWADACITDKDRKRDNSDSQWQIIPAQSQTREGQSKGHHRDQHGDAKHGIKHRREEARKIEGGPGFGDRD